MPGEVAFAACHGSSEDLPSKVLTCVNMGMLGGLDGPTDDESAVLIQRRYSLARTVRRIRTGTRT